jgi:transposase
MTEVAMPKVRIREPDHQQIGFRFDDPETALPPDHPARLLFAVVQTLDLSGFTRDAKAVEGKAGRSVLSPAMKLALWLYAISIGIGSAREIERRLKTDDAFRWLSRGLEISHHALSRFRVGHGQVLQALMVDVLASLLDQGLLSLERVAQDGTRVRTSASAPSFRREPSLQLCREQAELHLKAVLAEAEDEPGHAARVGKARELAARVEQAIATVKELQAKKKPGEKEARASTTDPEARVMKMPDGGFRPAYNVQLAVAGEEDGGPRTIVGVRVTNLGSDMGSITPMIREVAANTGSFPQLWLSDANHAKHACLEYAEYVGVSVLMAVPEYEKNRGKVPSGPVQRWRARMESEEGKRLYKARAGLVELVNGQLKSRLGLDELLVRGLAKVTCAVLLGALSFNLLQHAKSLLG